MRARRDFRNRTVVITGAAGGMGKAFCHAFGRVGAKLGLLDLESDALRTLEKELTEKGVECLAAACNVTEKDQCVGSINTMIKRFGGIDVLINNAGITHRSAFSKTDTEVFRRVMNVNYFGSLYCTKAALESPSTERV